ncbi:MAG: zinc ribbon domain-containing protein [Nanoarchaeota archaeon]
MIKKNKCKRCGSKISKKDKFCSSCGFNLEKDNKEDLGILGSNDFIGGEIKLPMGFNMLLKTLMKNLDKEMNNMNNKNKTKKSGISINFSNQPGKEPEIKINSFGDNPFFKGNLKQINKKEPKKEENFFSKKFSDKKIKEFSKLNKKEPETEVRRFSNSVVYEIKIPGVKSLEDISINKLENSIEIRAISGKEGYFKTIPIALPIKNYFFEKGVLSLELKN